ncbi:MAG: coenzyme F420-0:L-glutamate ligase [Candidatus Peregrinibacteria bacterium]
MHILPISTGLLNAGDNLAAILTQSFAFQDNDILVISSKAIATIEGAAIDLTTLTVSDEAKTWAKECGKSPAFCQGVLEETKRLNGEIVSSCPLALLTELQPSGLSEGSLLVPNAGLDESNVAKGFAIGWPHDPLASGIRMKSAIEKSSGKNVAVITSDSNCRPRRIGVTAFALTSAGIDPLLSKIGMKDLFGKPMTMTVEAVADQLATAANSVMGNAGESIPAAVIRDHGYTLSDFAGWVPGIAKEEDLFRGTV